jgi:hypothetical protein
MSTVSHQSTAQFVFTLSVYKFHWAIHCLESSRVVVIGCISFPSQTCSATHV